MKIRAYGADATLKACREVSYGVAPLSGYRSLDFKSCDLSSEQPLGDDPLLGRGRNAQDPYRELITDEGNVDIPLDVQGTGWWLTGLFGAPVTGAAVKATGSISFSGQPGANSTITLNGVSWSFVTGTPTGNQTQIGADLDATLTALATDLNASADVEIAKCTYTADTANDQLDIEFDTAGATGNAWTLAASAASNGMMSAAKLTGGGVPHVWESGSDTIPSYTIEVGHLPVHALAQQHRQARLPPQRRQQRLGDHRELRRHRRSRRRRRQRRRLRPRLGVDQHLGKASGFGIDEPLDLHDYACLRPMLTAMIRIENGSQPYTDAQIDAALVRAGVMPPERSLQETRTVKGGQVAAAGTIGAGAIGAIQDTVGQAHEALVGVVPYLDAAKWGLLVFTLIGIGVMLWARIDDRRKGLR